MITGVAVVDNKGIRTIWYAIAAAFLPAGLVSGKRNILLPMGFFLIIVGNIRSKVL